MQQVELTSIDGMRLDAAWHPARAHGHRGVVVQAHGINANMTEGGMFVRLAERLAEADFNVLRFSFRGHGDSHGTQRGMTIAGEMLDLQAAVEYMVSRFPGPLAIVASSFGAVSTSLSIPWLGDRLNQLALWNPVLDLKRTFVTPELPWGKENFNTEQQNMLATKGFLTLDGEFDVGRVLFEEFHHYDPLKCLTASTIPALVVHGDQDTAISYEIAQQAAAAKPNTEFHTIRGSDHGFDTREREDEAIAVTVGWLVKERESA
ncbi:Lysophospholipase, alpha-beta hydrolase superfamily [Saccharopolyspora antimicrobica]|uniref:Alpha-beta hydrolase superfamily lysophospholipase n=1 Tax=Saccharopolyspora antimicrobica TaxID=455193 RepID=A0A1I5AUN8_9PSEU|nr:alpha/beta fold hydrolase [Saccharopolyspora antimicrobica]RKT86374.1 alpha-beta hydrolase superfamily lysophospholipase [Saccharopolyspora antimicrobica]SFN66246.1 Lysophospholipase, alpha-beta hydrolase superfamily [Saccharopolyspora antimicrobica]